MATYKEAGVDVTAGYRAVELMKSHIKKTMRPEVVDDIGGFAGLFSLEKMNVQKPVLVSGTDGVGTKLKIAFMMDRHDTIGMDCVAMCANDVVCCGAQPLFFLDYIATGKLIPEKVEQIVKGVTDGCIQAGCALIGGETAEMPGFYREDEYDLAGFVVGMVDRDRIITGKTIREGDVLIGLASSGVHSNGFSLVRKVIVPHEHKLNQYDDRLGKSLGEEILTPTRIYVRTILSLIEEYEIKGIAHITGGGFIENIPRMVPADLGAVIRKGSWNVLPIFHLLQKMGDIPEEDMYNTFNMGIGMILAVSPEAADDVVRSATRLGEKAAVIGEIVKGGERITIC
ncbi:MAG: phosphoribosylformylglycinamidine cyclo-ligase [Clostridiaceae bacterium]|jgi:phosphoribosylformylglycinamidine cyclo-ligase|nr:phosphoribosylformylglycinamidine cyclo-ligase [Bacillota bacterium]NLI38185.1 phosphoribosylformylglycinamidine cyclo-ligase [Clostridiaceae bacterium]